MFLIGYKNRTFFIPHDFFWLNDYGFFHGIVFQLWTCLSKVLNPMSLYSVHQDPDLNENDHLNLDLAEIVIGVCELHCLGEFWFWCRRRRSQNGDSDSIFHSAKNPSVHHEISPFQKSAPDYREDFNFEFKYGRPRNS